MLVSPAMTTGYLPPRLRAAAYICMSAQNATLPAHGEQPACGPWTLMRVRPPPSVRISTVAAFPGTISVKLSTSCSAMYLLLTAVRRPPPLEVEVATLDYPSRCAPFFRLRKCRLNGAYDVHHCNNHLLANRVIQPLWFWTRANLPEEYTVELKEILEKHFTRFPYYPPFKEAIGKREWSPPNIVTKDNLKEYSFWKALGDLFSRTANGLTVKRNGEVLQDPIHRYLKLMRTLMVQLNSWSPEGFEQRDDMCREAHQLFWDLGFPLRKFGVPIHYFFKHHTPQLRKHGNLVGMSSVGGEHVNQPDCKIVQKRPSRPRGKCPVGLVEIMKQVGLLLGLWR